MKTKRNTERLADEQTSKIIFLALIDKDLIGTPLQRLNNNTIASYVSDFIEKFIDKFHEKISITKREEYNAFFQKKDNGRSVSNLTPILAIKKNGKKEIHRREASPILIEFVQFVIDESKNILEKNKWEKDWYIIHENPASNTNSADERIEYSSLNNNENTLPNTVNNDFKAFFGLKKKDLFSIVYGVFYFENNIALKKVVGDDKPLKLRRNSPATGESTIKSIIQVNNFLKSYGVFEYKLIGDDVGCIYEHDCTVISLGGSASSVLTKILLSRAVTTNPYKPNNRFFDFFKDKLGNCELIDLTKGNLLKINRPFDENEDYSIIEKLTNRHGKIFFICAGLHKHGTEAAVNYLFNRWEDLYSTFQNNDFGIILHTYQNHLDVPRILYQVFINGNGQLEVYYENEEYRLIQEDLDFSYF